MTSGILTYCLVDVRSFVNMCLYVIGVFLLSAALLTLILASCMDRKSKTVESKKLEDDEAVTARSEREKVTISKREKETTSQKGEEEPMTEELKSDRTASSSNDLPSIQSERTQRSSRKKAKNIPKWHRIADYRDTEIELLGKEKPRRVPISLSIRSIYFMDQDKDEEVSHYIMDRGRKAKRKHRHHHHHNQKDKIDERNGKMTKLKGSLRSDRHRKETDKTQKLETKRPESSEKESKVRSFFGFLRRSKSASTNTRSKKKEQQVKPRRIRSLLITTINTKEDRKRKIIVQVQNQNDLLLEQRQ